MIYIFRYFVLDRFFGTYARLDVCVCLHYSTAYVCGLSLFLFILFPIRIHPLLCNANSWRKVTIISMLFGFDKITPVKHSTGNYYTARTRAYPVEQVPVRCLVSSWADRQIGRQKEMRNDHILIRKRAP